MAIILGKSGSGSQACNIGHVFVTLFGLERSALLALNVEDGTGTCWGPANYGGDCSSVDFAGVTQVYSNEHLEDFQCIVVGPLLQGFR